MTEFLHRFEMIVGFVDIGGIIDHCFPVLSNIIKIRSVSDK